MFDKEIIEKVWGKALPLMNYDSCYVRMDKCGALIYFEEYGNRKSEYGW